MHSTGIVRKLDVLGRFTLPSEIRKQLDLCESDSLEVFVDHHKIILQKYQPADIFSEPWRNLLNTVVVKFLNIQFLKWQKSLD